MPAEQIIAFTSTEIYTSPFPGTSATWTARFGGVPTYNYTNCATDGAGTYAACAQGSSNKFACSYDDGVTWTEQSYGSTTTRNWQVMGWDGTNFFAVSYNSARRSYSPDAVSWTALGTPSGYVSGGLVNSAVYNEDSGEYLIADGLRLYYTTDILGAWTDLTGTAAGVGWGTGVDEDGIMVDGSDFVVVGRSNYSQNTDVYRVASGGGTPSLVQRFEDYFPVEGFELSDGMYVIMQENLSPYAYYYAYSSDGGSTWSSPNLMSGYSSPGSDSPKYVEAINNQYYSMVTDSNGFYHMSTLDFNTEALNNGGGDLSGVGNVYVYPYPAYARSPEQIVLLEKTGSENHPHFNESYSLNIISSLQPSIGFMPIAYVEDS